MRRPAFFVTVGLVRNVASFYGLTFLQVCRLVRRWTGGRLLFVRPVPPDFEKVLRDNWKDLLA